ncbi:MAG: aspartate aminotransferase family protein [Bacteroidota bacterium]
MKLFDVYSLLPMEPVSASGCRIYDGDQTKYLDLYGGHAVISVGHNHPVYREALIRQLEKISFYSNSVQNPLQEELADKLGNLSGYPDHRLFLCNSGAEAIENALKLASFATGRKRIIAMKQAFHGRTSGAVAITDNARINAPFNTGHAVTFVPMNDTAALDAALTADVAAVIIEGIQGVAGIHEPSTEYLQHAARKTAANGSLLIVDEIQSGYGRTGKFFAHQHAGITPDLITIAKGMGNGFPIGGVMIGNNIQPWPGMLGTTFGGNHLACAAAIAVLDIIRSEDLMKNAEGMGKFLTEYLPPAGLTSPIRGKGLMLGFDVPASHPNLRKNLIERHHIFTGEAKPNVIRLLPPLILNHQEAARFIEAIAAEFSEPPSA